MKYLVIMLVVLGIGCKKEDKKYCFECLHKTTTYSNVSALDNKSVLSTKPYCDLTESKMNEVIYVFTHPERDTVYKHDTIIIRDYYMTCTRK